LNRINRKITENLTKSVVLGLIFGFASATVAETPEEKGLAIAKEADERDSGWGDQTQDLIMTLRNKQGQESIRKIQGKTLEIDGDGDKSISIFDEPRDVKGTAFLSFTHALVPDEQWLYLPALKRVKRISSANKSGPFMGSEFAYEDISSDEIEKYKYKWLRDETVDGRDAFVVERYPQYEHSGYTRQVAWVDKNMWRPLKVEYYDRKNSLLKTMMIHDYNVYQDKFWRADRFEMVNHQTGKSTTITWHDYQFKTGLTDRDFDRNTLKRAR